MTQMSVLNFITSMLVLITACCLGVWALGTLVTSLVDYFKERKFASRVSMLDRWLCHDFPVVEDVCAFLLKPDESYDNLRERLRKKYRVTP